MIQLSGGTLLIYNSVFCCYNSRERGFFVYEKQKVYPFTQLSAVVCHGHIRIYRM